MNCQFVTAAVVLATPAVVLSQPVTTAVLRGGVCINEVLSFPDGTTTSFDTDGSGVAETADEFVELYNAGPMPADLSGLQIWDEGGPAEGLWFTFPPSTTLAPGAFTVVVSEVSTGGSLPAVLSPNLAFESDAGAGSFGRFSNGGENIALVDPDTGSYVQISYFGDGPVDFTTAGLTGFPGTTLTGSVEELGTAQPGTAAGRDPDGTTSAGSYYAMSFDTIPATPGTHSPNGGAAIVREWQLLE